MAVAERLQSRIFSGMDSADAWNEVSVDLIRCAKDYSNYVMVLCVLESMEMLSGVSSSLRRVLRFICPILHR